MDDTELVKLTISIQRGMLDELRDRARREGVTVTSLIRRAVQVERMVTAPDQELVLRDTTTGDEVVVRFV